MAHPKLYRSHAHPKLEMALSLFGLSDHTLEWDIPMRVVNERTDVPRTVLSEWSKQTLKQIYRVDDMVHSIANNCEVHGSEYDDDQFRARKTDLFLSPLFFVKLYFLF